MFERNESVENRGIILADPDPYLAFLIRQEFPTFRVEEGFEKGRPPTLQSHDIVIAEVDDPSEVAGMYPGATVLGVIDAAHLPGTLSQDASGMLVRPFLPSEVHRTVRSALDLPGGVKMEVSAARIRTLAAVARILAVGTGAAIELAQPGLFHASLFALLMAYVLSRSIMRAGRAGCVCDVLVAASAIALTGGVHSAYGPIGLIAVLGCGFEFGPTLGAAFGLLIAATAAPGIVHGLIDGTMSPIEVSAWFVFFMLGGFAGGFTSRVGGGAQTGTAMLTEANAVLSKLYRIARAMPGGLEPGIIADSVVAEIREVTASPAAAMLVRQVGSYSVAGSYGLVNPGALAGNQWEAISSMRGSAAIVQRAYLPEGTAAAWSGFDCFVAAPIRRDSSTFGVIMFACQDHALHQRSKAFIAHLAQECAVAVENSELFARVREMSIDEERQRLARDLHDGVAQAIAHLRLELDLLGRNDDLGAPVLEDLDRLGRVVQRAGTDVRDMILGLRSPVANEGLVSAIRSYVRDLCRLGGPQIDFRVSGVLRPSAEVESEVFRVVQEALSNALRHAYANRIAVDLTVGLDELRLVVEDDGAGFDAELPADGVGVSAMRERAARLGATLSFEHPYGRGTKIVLVCPIEEEEVA